MLPGSIVSARIVKIVKENPEIKSFFLKPLKKMEYPKPGQFYMVWVPDLEEIPISVSAVFKNLIRITVARRGETTNYMHSLREGDILGLKGPLGNSIKLERNRKYLFVAGGYGVAPLMFALRCARERDSAVTMLIGARTESLLLFEQEAKRLGAKVFVSTDDGSKGFKGTVVDLMKQILKRELFDEIIACGPEPVLIASAEIASMLGIKSQILAEEYMKCGIGVCGSCELGQSGLLVCRDGPVFNGEIFLNIIKEQ